MRTESSTESQTPNRDLSPAFREGGSHRSGPAPGASRRSRTAWLPIVPVLGLSALLAACGGSATETTEADPDTAASPAAAAPAAPIGSATVTGSVRFDGEAPNIRPIVMGADPQCEAKHDGPVANQALLLGDEGGLGNVLVRVLWTGGPVGAPSEPKVVDQQGCLYTPRVVGVQTGQTLTFLNSDELLHNVHSTSTVNPAFNRAMPAAIKETDVTYQQPEEPFLVKCDVHPWMAAYVTVLDHPFYAVTAADGSFEITGLPAGSYEIQAWHERLGSQATSVTVEDDGSASADFSFQPPA